MVVRKLWLLFLFLPLSLMAEDTMPGVFDEHIKSLRIHMAGNDFGAPIVVLGTDDRILIEFDHLAEDREYFRYSLVHCNANWQPSGLVDSEFLDGFNEGTIETFDFSRATKTHYVHYELTIPNEQVQPRISGNYLLKIYAEDDPDTTLLQCRFMVSEATAKVGANASAQTDIDYNANHQQVSVMVDIEDVPVEDPFNDLRIYVSQNGRMDNETSVTQPLRVSGTKLFFEHRPRFIFEAGNEYRRFEAISDYYPGMNVESIRFYEPYYHYNIVPDLPRADESYVYDETQNGRFFIREYNSDDSDIEADYGVMHLSLKMDEMPGTMVFVDGDFVQRRFDENSRLHYNQLTGAYERAFLLKQGAYNYQYLVVPPGGKRGYTAQVEGNHFQTINEYLIKVYHRRRGERYDRLIGTATIRTEI